jgi:cob(I)alamin adenosyltransferase
MDETARKVCRREQALILSRIEESLQGETVDLLVLDEVLDAVNTGMLEDARLRSLVEAKKPELEIVLTGRGPAPWLVEAADYISEIKKIKHPFDRGIQGRIGIEQ